MNPLVSPGPPLTAAQAQTYSRHLLLPQLGETAQRRLLAARVAVVGAGGLGSPALLYLAAAGVGTVGIIDDDVVERSNLHRQVLHTPTDIGRAKLDSATDHLAALAPDLTIEAHPHRLQPANAVEILRGYHLVLDGTDNFETRYAVSDACQMLGVPLVWGSVLGFDAQVSVFWSQPAGGVTLRDVFPTPPAPGTVPSCAEAGVLGAITGQVGSVMATEAIKLITGVGDPLLGRILVLDGLRQRWHEVPLQPAPSNGPARPATPTAAATVTVADTPDPVSIDVPQLADLRRREQPTLIDVREPEEVAGGAIPGALAIPLAQILTEGGRAEVPRNAPVVTYCQVGPRAQRAAAALNAAGFDARWLDGGYPAWVTDGSKA
ncbi:MAG: ThiF family adenylyltransferase [Beutenbergiaceae bacterium]